MMKTKTFNKFMTTLKLLWWIDMLGIGMGVGMAIAGNNWGYLVSIGCIILGFVIDGSQESLEKNRYSMLFDKQNEEST